MIWFLLGFRVAGAVVPHACDMPFTGLACFAGYCYLGSYGRESNETAIPQLGWSLGAVCLLGWLIQARRLYRDHQEQRFEQTRYLRAAAQNPIMYHGIEMLTGTLSRRDLEAANFSAQRMLRDVPNLTVERHWNRELLDLVFCRRPNKAGCT